MRFNVTVLFCLLVIGVALVLAGCDEERAVEPVKNAAPAPAVQQPVQTPYQQAPPVVVEEEVRETPQTCTSNVDCPGKLCIDKVCGTIEGLYSTVCEKTCKVSKVIVETSDKTTHDFVPGKGSYTGAGALEWQISSIPAHCAEQNELVPFLIKKMYYGRVVSEEVLTVREGATSVAMTHPNKPNLKFTLSVKDVVCA